MGLIVVDPLLPILLTVPIHVSVPDCCGSLGQVLVFSGKQCIEYGLVAELLLEDDEVEEEEEEILSGCR